MSSGQLLFGPVSDAVGRRPPIFIGLTLFILAGVACALAPDGRVLIAARLAQGLGASVGFAVSAAVIRDRYTGAEYARLFALCVLVLGVSPVLAPLAGSLIIAAVSWRYIFWATVGLGLGAMVLVVLLLPETHPPESRMQGGVGATLRTYVRLLSDRRFMSLGLANAVAQGAFFAYLAGSSFVLIQNYGLSPLLFSVAFGVNAIGLIGGAQFAPNLMRRLGPERLIRLASALLAVAALIPLAAELAHLNSLPVLLAALFVAVTAISQIGTPAMVLALRDYGHAAGAASALLGSFQIASGAVASGAVAAFADGSSMPMIAALAACGVGAFLLFALALRARPTPPA
jgi:DHA1 family bicyclomycin/chloramphenicol resistance-like MFS transporter